MNEILFKNLWQYATLPGYINIDGGTGSATDTNWKRSDFIEFNENETINMRLFGENRLNCYSFYDENKIFIYGGGYRGSSTGLFEAVITSPANTRYVKLCGGAENWITAAPHIPFYANETIDLVNISERLDYLEKDVEFLKSNKVVIDYWHDYVTITGYINKNGQLTALTDTNWASSDYINISEGIDIDIRSFGHTNVNSISFYDSDYKFISGVGKTGSVSGTFEQIVTSPASTAYMRLSGGSENNISAQSSKPFRATIDVSIIDKINGLQTQIDDIQPIIPVNRKQIKIVVDSNSKIILYGDSISSTDYTWYKEAMEQLTGATVYNGGFSAYNAIGLAKNAQLQRIFDYNPNIIVALLGGNDTGEPNTVGSFKGLNNEPIVAETDINVDYNGTYFIQAISHIMRKINKKYYNIRERANLTGNETEAEKTAKIDAVLKPYFVFCTTLPQNRYNSVSESGFNYLKSVWSNPENWKRKRDAVIECCEKYNVHCVDFFGLLDWDMDLEPYWVGPTDKVTNNGIYTMDGLHPNKYGYKQMASLLCGELGII